MATRTAICRMDGAWTRTDEGYLDSGVNPTKAGVFKYLNKDGTVRRELRPRSEVHKADSLKTLENRPHTNSHPPTLLNSRNVKRYKTGTVYGKHEVAEDGTHTKARVMVMDADTISDIEQGKEQVSCGYTCDLDETPGTDPEFGEYDAIQRNIRYNHLASEWRGRAGSGARLTRDADELPDEARFDAWEIDDDPEPITQTKSDSDEQEIQPMASIRIDEEDFEIPKDLEKPLTRKFKADAAALSDAESKAKAEADRADKAEGELQAAKARLDSYEQAEQQQARVALQEQAAKVLKGAKFDGLSDRQIKEQVITAKLAIAKFDGYNDAHIEGMYTAALAVKPAGNAVMDAYDAAGSKTRTDEEDPIAAAYQKQIAAMTGATKE